MKRTAVLILVLNLLFLGNSYSQSNLVFGVKPGMTINSAYFGIKMNNLVPFMGADLFWISVSGDYSDSYSDSWTDYYGDLNKWESVESGELSGSAFLLIPHFGCKYYFNKQEVRPYIVGDLFFSIPSVSGKVEWSDEDWEYENGQLIYHDIDKGSDELEDDVKDIVNDILSFWGINTGFGAEYFFNPNFSIGGEFGLRLIFNSVEYKQQNSENYSSYSNYTEKWEGELSASLKLSYAVFSLNFYL